jgi:WD40 repeat protein
MSWSPDGRLLAGPCSDGRIYLWQTDTGERQAVLERHSSVVTAVEFNHQGDLLVSCGWDGMTRFWEPNLSRLSVSIPGGLVAPGFSRDDQRLGIGTGEREIGIWQVEPARECRRLGQMGDIYGAAFAPEGDLLASAGSDGIRFWSVGGNRLLGHLRLTESRSVSFHPDGNSLVTSGHAGLNRWPIHADLARAEWTLGPAEALSALSCERSCLSPDGRTLIASGCEQGDLVALDLDRPGQPTLLKGHAMAVATAASPCGKWVATATWHGNGIKIWSTQTWRPLKELPVRGSALSAFSPNSEWLLTGSPTEYCFWKTGSWDPGLTIPRDRAGDFNGTMAFSPDGRMVALLIGRNSQVRLIALPQGQELATLDTGEPLCFSPDNSQLATSGEDRRTLFVWDLRLIRHHLAAMKLDFDLPHFLRLVKGRFH